MSLKSTKSKKTRSIVRPKLQRADVRKSAIKKPKRTKSPDIEIKHQDAFEFLRNLTPNSVSLIVSSPPYCMGKEYERSLDIKDFILAHEKLAPLLERALKSGGSVCWQVGHHVKNGVVIPLDAIVYQVFSKQKKLLLRNRIVWTFGHGVHASRRFSGRHETILWFTKGDKYKFNLDAVRVPQKYPGKRHYKGPKKGEFSGNPKGKNPSDVWEIPNVKANHVEKTAHPCQFPVALVQRLVRALTKKGDLIVDPFMGSGTSAFTAALEGRSFVGCDIKEQYVIAAKKRVASIEGGQQNYRPVDRPIHIPSPKDAVAQTPFHWKVR